MSLWIQQQEDIKRKYGTRHHTNQEMVPHTVCRQNHRLLCKAMSWKPTSNRSSKGGWTRSRDTNIQLYRKHILLTNLQNGLFPGICWRPMTHIHAPVLNWLYLLNGPWHGPGPGRSQACYCSIQLHSSSFIEMHPTPSPQEFITRHQDTTGFPCYSQHHGRCLPGAAFQEATREKNWKGTDTVTMALAAQRQTLQEFSAWWEAQFRNEAEEPLLRKSHENSDKKGMPEQ